MLILTNWNIYSKSYLTLDRMTDLLVNKDFSLKLAGLTDNIGSAYKIQIT